MNKIDHFFSSLFTREQREKIITTDGKRLLYFDRIRDLAIKYSLEVKTTCGKIYNTHKNDIIEVLKYIYGENVDLNAFSFYIIEIASNKVTGKSNLIDLKLRMEDLIFNMLQNSQLFLCYIPYNKPNLTIKRNARNLSSIMSLSNNMISNIPHINSNKTEIYLKKETIHFYFKNIYAFQKINIQITDKGITLLGNTTQEIPIQDVKEIKIFMSKNPVEIENFYQNYLCPGKKPNYVMEVLIKNDKILIGNNSFDKFSNLTKALEKASINYQNHYTENMLNSRITEINSDLFSTNNFIAQSSIKINDLVINKDKRAIFFKKLKEKNFVSIVDNIMEYKVNFNKKNLNSFIINIKNILKIIEEIITNEENGKYQNFINTQVFEKIKNILEQIQVVLEDTNLVEEDTKLDELKKFLNPYTFDDLYLKIKVNILDNFYNENTTNEREIKDSSVINFKRKINLLLGYYSSNIFNLNNNNSIVLLGSEDLITQLTKEFNKSVNDEKYKKKYVLE